MQENQLLFVFSRPGRNFYAWGEIFSRKVSHILFSRLGRAILCLGRKSCAWGAKSCAWGEICIY
jgi:hypothetical protein